jgi:hypothetical protein
VTAIRRIAEGVTVGPAVINVDIATPLSTSGRFIVDAHGRRVRLAGVYW